MNTKGSESEASAAERKPVSSLPASSPVIYRSPVQRFRNHCPSAPGAKAPTPDNTTDDAGFEAFTAVTMKNAVFWDVAQCSSCVNRCFGGMCRLHIQRRKFCERGTSVSRWLAAWRRHVPPKRRFTQDLHGATSQEMAFFNTKDVYRVFHLTCYPCILL
jgi:hypothetical protein